MTLRVSPLGLPLEYLTAANASVNISGAAATGAAGSVTAGGNTLPKLSPLGLPILGYTQAIHPAGFTIVSAQAPAQAGTVTVNAPTTGRIAQLGPWILAGKIRTINAVVGNENVFLVGAQAIAQGEELEGADATIRIDGAGAAARAGASIGFISDFVLPVASRISIDIRDNQTVLDVKVQTTVVSLSTSLTFIDSAMRVTNVSVASGAIDIQMTSARIDIT
jgi:hypothetical protein